MNRQIFLSSKKNIKRAYTLQQLEALPFQTYDTIKFEHAVQLLSFRNVFSEPTMLKRMLDAIHAGLENKKEFKQFIQISKDNGQSLSEQESQLMAWYALQENQQPIDLIYSSEKWLNNIIYWLFNVGELAMQKAGEQQDFLLRDNVFQSLSIINQVIEQYHQLLNEQEILNIAFTLVTDTRFRSICFQIIKNMTQRYALDMFSDETTMQLIKASTDDISNIDLMIDGLTLYVAILEQLYKKIQFSQFQSDDIIQRFNQRLHDSEYIIQIYQNMINIICGNVPEQYLIHKVTTALSYMISINKDLPVAKIVQEMMKRLDFNNNECDYRTSVLHFFSCVALTQQIAIIDNKIFIDSLLSMVDEYIRLKQLGLKNRPQNKKISLNEIIEICILLANMSCNQQCLETIGESQYMTINFIQQTICSTVHIISESFIKISGQIITSLGVIPFDEATFYQLMIEKTHTLLSLYNQCQISNKQFTQKKIFDTIFEFWDDFISRFGRNNTQYELLYETLQNYSTLDIVQNLFRQTEY